MTQTNKPTCFVAMAFDHADTDSLYDKQILPTLKKLGIKFIRIDRRQSNDDINIQIIDQLNNADFCITDLTYARPSVYFEAGFAQKSIPVIYTVRKDHLNPGQPDGLRVHFDLQMKPIIDWKSPDDNSFANRLEKRLRATILIGWKRSNIQQSNNEKEIQKFSTLPLRLRLISLRRQAIYAMRRVNISLSSFVVDGFLNPDIRGYTISRKEILKGRYNNVVE